MKITLPPVSITPSWMFAKAALAALAVGIAVAAPAQTSPPRPPQPGITEVEKLAPVATVPGCGERALPVAKRPKLPAPAFAEMKRYSDSLPRASALPSSPSTTSRWRRSSRTRSPTASRWAARRAQGVHATEPAGRR
jgi:hypothetical protein